MKTFWSPCKLMTHGVWPAGRVARRHPLLAHHARSAYARFLVLSSRTGPPGNGSKGSDMTRSRSRQ
jgi:hypothetical protein